MKKAAPSALTALDLAFCSRIGTTRVAHTIEETNPEADSGAGTLAGTNHEDVLQTQQLVSWWCFVGSGDAGDPERVVEEARFREVPPGDERPPKAAGCEVWCACS